MKLKSYIFAGLAMLALSACNEDFGDWQQQAVNTATTLSFGEGKVEPVGVIDFAAIAEGTELVKVCNITAPTTSIEESELNYTLNIDGTEFPLNANGEVSYPDFKSFVEATYGKAPKVNEIAAKVNAYVGTESTKVRYTEEVTIQAKPDAPFIDEGGYYLVGDFYTVGDINGWSVAGAQKFNQIGGGDVYENPIFTITVEVKATDSKTEDWYWKIIPANNYDGDFWKEGNDGVVGTLENGDASFEGALTTNSPQAGRIKEPGLYKFTIDMMNYKYTIEAVNYATYIWQAGNSNGWGSPASPLVLIDDNTGEYEGFMYLDGQFKFRSQEDGWAAPDWGDGGAEGVLEAQAGNLSADPGFYAAKVNLSLLTYTLTPITTIGIIGSATENGWAESTPMTWSDDEKCWVLDTHLKGGTGFELKFRGNDNWDNETGNWGGTSFSNIENGSNNNIPVEKEGDVTIKFYPSCNGKTYATLTYK